jgi:predicted XRE-type DNA-binding protein
VTKNNKTTNSSDLQDKIRDAQVKNILEKLKSGKTLTARESVIIGEYAAEKDNNGKKLTQRDIAKAWGMTQPNVHKMVKQGMPMDSMEAAAEWRKDFLEGRGRGSDAPASLNDARLRKTLLECERIELALAVDRGEYSKNTEVKESGIRVGSIFTAKLNALVNDASGALAGLDEASLKKKLHERVQGILAEIQMELAKV